MADWFYFVNVALDEESIRLDNSQLLVQLICEDHAKYYEADRQSSASRIAKDAVSGRYPSTGTDIGYTEANRFSGELPSNFAKADFVAPCGCRAWYWRGL